MLLGLAPDSEIFSDTDWFRTKDCVIFYGNRTERSTIQGVIRRVILILQAQYVLNCTTRGPITNSSYQKQKSRLGSLREPLFSGNVVNLFNQSYSTEKARKNHLNALDWIPVIGQPRDRAPIA